MFSPTIVIDHEFVDSGTLQRHELSALIGDMPDTDFQSLMDSITTDGIIDNIINIHEGQILDGWHRFRACQELNLLRKLRFKDYETEKDGDPVAFVLARNVERRQLSAAQRAQVSVAFNERFGHGGDRSKSHNGGLKTRQQLAAQAGVGTTTIDRAIAIEKAGESEAVISGEKTAGEVLNTREAAKSLKRKKQLLKDMWDKRKQASTDYIGDGDTDLNQYLTLNDLEKGFAKNNAFCAEAFQSGMKRIGIAASFQNFQERALETDEFGNAKVNLEDLEKELKAISTYSFDIFTWQRPSPPGKNTNWILPLIQQKKEKTGKDPVSALIAQIEADITAFRNLYAEHYEKGITSLSDMFTAGHHRIQPPQRGASRSRLKIRPAATPMRKHCNGFKG